MKKVTFMKKPYGFIAVLLSVMMLTSCADIEQLPVEGSQSSTTASEITTAVLQLPETSTTSTTEATTEVTELSTSETSIVTTTPVTTATPTTTTTITTTVPTTTTTVTTTPTTTTVTTTTPPKTGTNSYVPLNYDEQIGIWIAYLDINGWIQGSSEAQFRSYITSAFDNCKNIGANTVYVHVRAFSDAYYNSSYYPWSNFKGGPGGNPGYDPLAIMIDIAHAKGLSFHAWLNPMRVMTDANLANVSNNFDIKKWYNDSSKRGTYIVKPTGNSYYWLNPAYSDVRQLIYNGVREIVQKYDVDAIHIDDYFYPTTDASFDSAAFKSSGSSSLSTWRFSNTDTLVSGIYSTIKSVNPRVEFGVSPQGNMGNNYSTMYADVKKWCSTPGYLDYITPQIYFTFSNKYQPYKTCATGWNDIVKLSNVKLIFGLAPYRIGETGSPSDPAWATETRIIAREIEYSRTLSNYSGVALYRYNSLFAPASSVASKVNAEIAEIKNLLN